MSIGSRTSLLTALEEPVAKGQLAGAAALVWHNSRTRAICAGWREVESQIPIERDTLFRIASLTKPITSVAALTLLDEGRFALHGPIAQYAPEFADMRVLRSPEGPLDETDAASR